MNIIYTENHKRHNPPFEIYDGVKERYAEKAERLDVIVSELQRKGYGFTKPRRFPIKHIASLHQQEYISFIQRRSEGLKENEVLYPSYHIMDTYTPITPGTFSAAQSSVDVALTGATLVHKGERVVYSLCRPPGHHAEQKEMSGYCYFNNAAIAADYLSAFGKVAILDVDFHHGNGTQNLFYERDDVYYVSLHADPRVRFPYSSGFTEETGHSNGVGFNKNFPLPLGTDNTSYMRTLRKALKSIASYKPNYLIVSLGFDTYEKDPIGGFALTISFYADMAREIMKLGLPTLLIQEGGYNTDALGKMSASFLSGIEKEVNNH